MATYNLNEVLKAREASEKKREDGELTLDDVSRVKVLSPGRQVFKRFIRNRLAVFGSVMLILMFVFSFIGPIFYAYGQKQIFYKYDAQNVNYAMAKENTAYNGYDVDASVVLERAVVNAMNSNIKKMIAEGRESMIGFGTEGGYQVRRLGDDIYMLSAADLEPVCAVGSGTAKVGTYDSIRKTIQFNGAEVEGLAEAAAGIKGSGGTVELDGLRYTFRKGAAKSYDVTVEMDGLHYTGAEPGEGFGEAVTRAAETGEGFRFEGSDFVLEKQGGV